MPSRGDVSGNSRLRPAIILAFLTIYIVWGSTYYAIRVAVAQVPPLFAAGVRFVIAGAAVYLWGLARRESQPTRPQWRNIAILAALMFLLAYGGVFWAEKTVPSGITAVLIATTPLLMSLLEIFVLKQGRLTPALVAGIAVGFTGVAILTLDAQAGQLDPLGCVTILACQICWCAGTILSKKLDLPRAKLIVSGSEMFVGGVLLLTFSALAGELHPFPHVSPGAAAAIAYLIVAGSILAFTAYVWLLGQMPATSVASYAYVNPVIALAVGWWLGDEQFGPRTLLGAVLILAGVVLLLRRPAVIS